MKLLAALVVAGACASAATAANAPVIKHTSAGNSVAGSSLLTAKVLGKGWTASKPVTGGLRLTCPGYQPSMKGIVETGAADSPNFSAATAGPFILQQTSVYATAAQASALWSRAVKPGLIACVEQSLGAVTAHGIKVKITSAGPLALTSVAPMTAAYRVIATLTSKKQKLKTYFDVVLIGSGATVSEITISSFQVPVPKNFEQALAKIVGHNLTVPTA